MIMDVSACGPSSWAYSRFAKRRRNKPSPQPNTDRRASSNDSKVVINHSHRPLNTKEEVLALGFNFAISPSRIPVEDIITFLLTKAHRLMNIHDVLITNAK